MPPKKVKSVESSDSEELFPPPDPPKRPKEAEKSKAARVARKASAHPSTMEMVKEALKALDSRKGSSAQAIRGYILDKYPSVDAVRLKYMLRKALTKGIESGDLVRPANSSGNGAQGRFRIPAKSKTKEIKAKASENTDPNAGRALKAEKAAVKTSKVQEGPEKVKLTAKKQRTKTAEAMVSPVGLDSKKGTAAKKPKAKKVAAAASQTSEKVTGAPPRKGKSTARAPPGKEGEGVPAPRHARKVAKIMT
ncbi:linker histone H1M isoform X2 [Scleropages formosus]|uniref:linker histone H1M isoform X2 n=1 Tax=Scleropages formosus TaxID=113540 RepID=UPI0008790143|nr:sperm-specific protein PHI-2B-like isoform X2 [Scleropages formosus]